ncbi:HTH_MerR-trunc domain-containing protein [Acidipropionibacterium acidipropionici ATCC 4875]|uniref:HTH_MerR-trunc domain-containing protein n=1 Tax=Acidipropionibacterium acidipropionici (strain ATCC 4875 / DSM 20272 / JCM 6432 / NBRC 12425 / NCIMB 8070 / 4) TaxID=1171373 RepID=K7S3X8_ACIA4|nr:HTH_MerR-trunc domain-containing protein [Acidipropionibacterium acidipropionici ATCC 4875]
MSTGEAARHLGVGAQAVRRWCEAGKVAGAVQLPSGRWRLPWSAVVEILGSDPREELAHPGAGAR